MSNKFKPLLTWNPTVKYQSKSIEINNIVFGDESTCQVRVHGISDNKVKELEASISDIGLQEPIEVEVDEFKPHDPDNTTYKLRNGGHRLAGFRNLRNRYGSKYDRIPCVVYEKNTNLNAELEWSVWQLNSNTHKAKLHMANSIDDMAYHIDKLLRGGMLSSKATAAFKANDWKEEPPVIEDSICDYISADPAFNTVSKTKRIKILEKIFDRNNEIYKHKIKRYSAADKAALLDKKFKSNGSGKLSQDGKRIVRFVNNNDFHAQILLAMRPMLSDKWDPNIDNVIVFHSKQTDCNHIDSKRESAYKLAKSLNKWYQKTINSPNAKLINKFYYLGQKLAAEHGEKVDQLIAKKL
jgi:hypothetical protein